MIIKHLKLASQWEKEAQYIRTGHTFPRDVKLKLKTCTTDGSDARVSTKTRDSGVRLTRMAFG